MTTSCTHVTIHDAEFCGDAGELGASCFHTLTNQSRDIPKAEWDDYRFGQLCATPSTFAEMKETILKLCKVTKSCSFEEKEMLKRFGEKIERFEKRLPEPGFPAEDLPPCEIDDGKGNPPDSGEGPCNPNLTGTLKLGPIAEPEQISGATYDVKARGELDCDREGKCTWSYSGEKD